MGESMYGLRRSSLCAKLSRKDVGREITIMGWVQRKRNLGGMVFILLRDVSGMVQVVFNEKTDKEVLEKVESVKSEYVLAIIGKVYIRNKKDINKKMKTGEIEVMGTDIRILSEADTPPIYIEENIDANELIRLKYRYLDLRRPDMQRNLILRHNVVKIARKYYDERGFLEIETPVLTKSTPEGARDYLVPSRIHNGKYFALPQSPQLFKQLLMVSGFDRYFQIVKCFRDEDLRADRQPEFTQMDLEMSFVSESDVIRVNEVFLKRLFRETLGVSLKIPFKKMTYKEAMERFGTDKPDTRFGMELIDITDLVKDCNFKVFSQAVSDGGSVRAINIVGGALKFSRKDIDKFNEFVKTYKAKGLAWIMLKDDEIKTPLGKFFEKEELIDILKRANAKQGDLVFFIADKDKIVFDALGQLRLEVANKMDIIDPNKFNFLWVTEFPLLEYDEEGKRWVAKHHPFTSPMECDIEYLDTDPGKVRARAYDIVLNGVEVGGGSIRIHIKELQSQMFKLLGISDEEALEKFGYLLEAFKYGTPPHGGLAFGLDRLIMLMAKRNSIRDVIAFPKVQNSSCPLTGAPDLVSDKQLEELHIKNVEN